MEHLSTFIFCLFIFLKLVIFIFLCIAAWKINKDIAFLKTWLRRTYLQSSYLYQASLIEARAMAIRSENYEMVKTIDKVIRQALEDMERILK